MTLAEHLLSCFDVVEYCVNAYLNDLTDDDLLLRPHPKANHIAWQLGHLISSEYDHRKLIYPGDQQLLPPGFAEKHTKGTASIDDPAAFYPKADYLDLMAQQRTATKAILQNLTDTDLQASAPEELSYFGPTIANVFAGEVNHWMMHTGQWVVVRRVLGKEHIF